MFTISIDAAECAALHTALAGAGADHAWAAADLTDEAATVAAVEACLECFGTIDGLFAVAGGSGRKFGDGPTDGISLEAWHATLDLNLTTTFLAVREVVRHMLAKTRPGGSIVVTSSVLADHPSPHRFSTHAYAAAKGAQLAFVRAAAARYASADIRVNAIEPGVVLTPMSARAQSEEGTLTYIGEKQPLAAGFIPAEDVAAAALFLLSDDARYVTGQILAVDGGWSVTEARS